jgi:hypothetical protein
MYPALMLRYLPHHFLKHPLLLVSLTGRPVTLHGGTNSSIVVGRPRQSQAGLLLADTHFYSSQWWRLMASPKCAYKKKQYQQPQRRTSTKAQKSSPNRISYRWGVRRAPHQKRTKKATHVLTVETFRGVCASQPTLMSTYLSLTRDVNYDLNPFDFSENNIVIPITAL